MRKITKPTRFALALALGSLVVTSAAASNQASPSEAANAAEQIAQDAENAIRRIDPTTGGRSLIADPSLPAVYGADIAPNEAPETSAADLPPLTNAPAPTMVPAPTLATPRGPATRMISAPLVQPALLSPPAPAAKKMASKDPFVVKSILPIEGTIRYGEWFWDEGRAPAKGKLVITVDLDARVISVFRDGHEIGTAVALLGTKKHPTPLGTFPILTKEKDNISEKYNNAPMPWTLRMTWDGIAIHGSPVLNGYASHGCVGVPDAFAEKLFAIAKRGDKVVVTRGSLIGVGDKII